MTVRRNQRCKMPKVSDRVLQMLSSRLCQPNFPISPSSLWLYKARIWNSKAKCKPHKTYIGRKHVRSNGRTWSIRISCLQAIRFMMLMLPTSTQRAKVSTRCMRVVDILLVSCQKIGRKMKALTSNRQDRVLTRNLLKIF